MEKKRKREEKATSPLHRSHHLRKEKQIFSYRIRHFASDHRYNSQDELFSPGKQWEVENTVVYRRIETMAALQKQRTTPLSCISFKKFYLMSIRLLNEPLTFFNNHHDFRFDWPHYLLNLNHFDRELQDNPQSSLTANLPSSEMVFPMLHLRTLTRSYWF